MTKRTALVVVLAIGLLAIMAAPAFAEGYTDPATYTRANDYFQGPHGGYTTTSNKCQACHSTHYAAGSFMLMRANSREAACDFCHGGGGGSSINIQMDNDYRAGNFDQTQASAVTTTTMGYGTGHTLGYAGAAPADINPAYTAADGFACFDCHTPHGNSARVLTTFANPGRVMYGTTGADAADPGTANYVGNTDGVVDGVIDGTPVTAEWGASEQDGHFILYKGGKLMNKPIWPTGRFLLLKNPHSDADEGQDDMQVSDTADNGLNKIAINWDSPLGPADTPYGGEQDNDPDADFPWATDGFLGLSEFCTDCHDGTAGASTQSANVYVPGSGYEVVYSHDAQPRH